MAYSSTEKMHFHRAMSKIHQGGLHRALGVSESKTIPMSKKMAAAHSSNKHMAAMGRMAVAMSHWKHGSKGTH